MAMVCIKCPECSEDIEVELPENMSLIIDKCDKCGNEISLPDGSCITVCKNP